MSLTGFVILCIVSFTAAQSCGRPSFAGSRVIGGQNARHGSWPWQILLLDNNRPGCGGSIIGPRHILTASHCVVDSRSGRVKPAYSFTVRVGDNNRNYYDSEQRDYRVARVTSNPSFSFRSFVNDVAILELSTPIRYGNYVKPVCLPSAPARVGQLCYITGWGRVNRNTRDMHYQLQQAQMPVVAQSTCANAMRRVAPFPIGGHSLCSGHGRGQISGCQGDSGGPFVCQNRAGAWELHGAVSWGSQDCSKNWNEYTVYANVFNMKSWILRYARV